MSISYAAERMREVIDVLSCLPEPLQNRLVMAYFPAFMNGVDDSSQGDYLPEDLQQRMRILSDRMTSSDSYGDEDRLQASTLRMDDVSAQECAREMVQIALEVIGLAAQE
jgi:hypothetical protein